MKPTELLEAAREFMAQEKTKRDLISSWDSLLAYLRLNHPNGRIEVFRVLFLDRKNRLIEDSVMGFGTIDHCPVYVREVIRKALVIDASAMILCHNHPSGETRPSEADISMTKQIIKAADLFGIVIHDHVIIGENESSMRQGGHM